VTLVALVTIIALAACGLIVVMLAIATHVEPIDDDASDAVSTSAPPPQPQLTGAMPAPSDAPSPRETPEGAAAQAQKPPQRSAWHGIAQAWTSWRHRHADDLLYYDGPHRRRRGVYKERAWLAAAIAFSVVLVAYLIVHI